MQSPPPETYTYPQRVPESTNDVNLKRARVVDNDGKSYIRVTGTVTSSDLDPIKEALGEPTDTSSENTVIGLLKKIDVKQFGVGQAYPGSTGGEIFNYYGTDSNKNVASGDYSTAIGLKNTSAGNYSFTAGNSNEVHGTSNIALGESNVIANVDNVCAIGKGNAINGGNRSVIIGRENVCTKKDVCVVGRGLSTKSENCTYVGSWNDSQNENNNNHFVVGVGSSSSNPKTAIQCTNTYTKISTPLRLNYDSTEVDAITAPFSSPASADDKTLATKAYVDANSGFTPESTEIYADHIYTTDEPPIDLGEIPYQKGRVVLRGTLTMSGYSFANDEAEATFEARFDLTAPYIDQYVQQTIFSYDSNKVVAVTLTIKFHIVSGNHLEITLQNNELSGVVFYDQYRVAQGHNVPPNVNFDTMNSHSYFYNY